MSFIKYPAFIPPILCLFLSYSFANSNSLFILTIEGLQKPVPVYSDSHYDVYTDDKSFAEAKSIRDKTRNFQANLYFVFKDETERQNAIAEITTMKKQEFRQNLEGQKEHILTNIVNNPNNSEDSIKDGLERIRKIDDRLKTPRKQPFDNMGKIEDLRYITSAVTYNASGMLNVAGGGPGGNGPLLLIGKTVYNSTITTSYPLFRSFETRESKNLSIISQDFFDDRNPSFIGRETGAWNIFAGYLHPTTGSIRLKDGRHHLLYMIIQNIAERINQ